MARFGGIPVVGAKPRFGGVPVSTATPTGAPSPSSPAAGPMDYVSQGLSGLNEGLAQGLGAPVDLAALLINAGTSGINALAHTNIPAIEHPFGGSETFRGMMAPTIAAPTADPGQQVVRRIAQEVGSAVIPGAGLAARTAKPLATLASEAAAAVTGGAGAAAGQQVAPGNPWAELGGELAGSFTPATLVNSLKRATLSKAAPTLEEIMAAKSAAYDAADSAGVKYKPQAFKRLAADMVQSALDDNISAARHPVATSMLKDIVSQADSGSAPSLTQLDQLRQVIRRDVTGPAASNPAMRADGHFGNMMVDKIDDFIAHAGHGDVLSGDPAKAGALILTARELNTRARKVELVQDAISKAKLQAASSGSGGNINNALRQQFKAILNNKSRIRAFSTEERATITGLVRQGKFDELLRYVGKFSPGGSGLIGALELGATAVHPVALAAPAAGFVAKSVADARTVGKAERLAADVARGERVVPSTIRGTPAQIAAAKQQLLVGLTNLQNQERSSPTQITVNGGAR